MNNEEQQTVFDVIGNTGFECLVSAFYRRIPNDPILGPLYPDQDFAGAEQRLRDFLLFRFGGPADYIERRSHPALRMRHAPFAITRAVRDRWVELMEAALLEARLPQNAARELKQFFDEAATFLINRG